MSSGGGLIHAAFCVFFSSLLRAIVLAGVQKAEFKEALSRGAHTIETETTCRRGRKGTPICKPHFTKSGRNKTWEPLRGQPRFRTFVENEARSVIEMLLTDPDDLFFLVLGLNHERTKWGCCASLAISKWLNWQIN